MWLITNFGFFSIVQKPGDQGNGHLTIRARAEGDLEALRETLLPQLGPIESNTGSDYRFRATAPVAAIAKAAAEAVMSIDYANFKDSVAAKQGQKRANLYHQVWTILNKIENSSPPSSSIAKPKSEIKKASAFGGVLIDPQGRILLREPQNHYDGYVWTFAKGKPNEGEGPEAAALREVREETGFDAEIIDQIPGVFTGGTGASAYYLMRPLDQKSAVDPKETAGIRWVTADEARALISKTTNKIGKKRDLAVLDAALAVYFARKP